MLDIKIVRTTEPKAKPQDESKLGFGKIFTDHMFLMDYTAGEGWHDARVVPYGPWEMDPATTVFHYAQEIFEGMKAYRTPDGKINLFRPDMNAKRLNRTNERMCIPFMDEELFIEAVKATVHADEDWIPTAPGTALYIRPYIISDEVSFSVEPAKHYHFIIILCAVGAYYDINRGGLTGSHIYVEDEYIRAAVGGTGFAKVGGNYAGGMRATKKALEAGASGIVVSNHGGRVLDQCPATAEVLPAIVDAVGGKMTILVDGGIRTGMDVFKALALGADAVLIGRPFVNMVYGGGAEGVQVYVDKLKAELADTMAMCGAHKLSDIKRSMIFGY